MAIFIIAIVALATESGIKRSKIHKEILRKLLHVVAVSLAALVPLLLSSFVFLKLLTLISAIIAVIAVSSGTLNSIRESEDKSWGIIYFSLFYTVAIFVLPASHYIFLSLALFILAISDTAAALVGTFTSKSKYYLTGVQKSYFGSAAFFITSLLISFLIPRYFNEMFTHTEFSTGYLVLYSLIASLILTLIEALSYKGVDNFLIPLFGMILGYIFLSLPDTELLYIFLTGLSLAGIVAALSFRVKFLTANGAISTFLLAGFIFGLGGWKWSIPIMTFFILSSLLSKVRKKKNVVVESYFEKSGTRDFAQVFANGGVGGILVIINALFPAQIWFYAYVASLAAVTSDTWATEIGTLKKNRTYNILNLKPLPQGMSGGISLAGTSGGIVGALVVTISALYWFDSNILLLVGLLVVSGMFGSFFDSYLGATLQVQYSCEVCGKVTENSLHCETPAILHRGNKFINNDMVNLFAGIFGCLFFILIWGLFQI